MPQQDSRFDASPALLQGVDWRDDKHWGCNDNVHPSRHGTYDGITMHPFETVFVKSSWHVGEPFTSHYSKWFMGYALGQVSQKPGPCMKPWQHCSHDRPVISTSLLWAPS